jgi:hypothetical protein
VFDGEATDGLEGEQKSGSVSNAIMHFVALRKKK